MEKSKLKVTPATSRKKKDFNEIILSIFKDYALDFPVKGVSDFVNIWGMPSLTQFTVCLWMTSSDTTNNGALFSYAVPGTHNELLIFNYRNFRIYINDLYK